MGQVGQLMVLVRSLEGQIVGQDLERGQVQGQVMVMQGQQTALEGQVSALLGQVASKGVEVQGLVTQLLEVEEERDRLAATLQEVRGSLEGGGAGSTCSAATGAGAEGCGRSWPDFIMITTNGRT
jgi:hypothetical protein